MGDAESAERLEHFRAMSESVPFSQHLGIRIEEMAHGRSRLRLASRPELCNLAGSTVHGGVLATMVDAAANAAVLSSAFSAPDWAGEITAELNISFLGSAPGESELVAEACVLRCGRTLSVAEAEVRAGDELVAKGRATFRMVRR